MGKPMPQMLAGISKPLTFRELKEFAATAGPALSVYTPSEVPGGSNRRLPARLKKIFADQQMADTWGEAVEAIGAESPQGPGLVMFASPETFRHFWLPRTVADSVHTAANFYVRPLLDLLEGDQSFYILALSQKDVRLLRCSGNSSEEVNTGGHIPPNMTEFLAMDQPDHNLRGASMGATFGTSSDKDIKDEYLHHFYAAVNKGVNEILRDEGKTPLIAAGVDFELALYGRINTYPHYCPGGVQGAANGLKGGELHARAIDCLARCRDEKIDALLSQHEKQSGGAADASVKDIVRAAYDGRVAHLLIAQNGQSFGNFDEASHRVHEHRKAATGHEDLLNAAAVQTILHAGDVYVLPDERIPGGRPAAAVMRY